VEAWVARRRGSHIFWTVGSQMEVKLSTLRAGRLAALYPQEDSWYSFLLKAESTPGPWCGWKDLGQMKNSVTSGIEPATFRLVA
jgi:hypothetical protein